MPWRTKKGFHDVGTLHKIATIQLLTRCMDLS